MPRDRLSKFWIHTVTVHPLLEQGADGADVEAGPVVVTGFLEDTSRLVRAVDTSEVLSTATFYTAVGNGDQFPLDSRVVLPLRTARVISVNVNDSGPLGLPDHCAISLT